MDIEKGSVKRQKKCSKRSRSSSSSSEDNNSGSSRRKRRLKESKLTKNGGKELTRTDVEGNNGDEFGRKIKGRKRRGKVKRKEESEDSSSPSSSESKRRRKKKRKEKKRKEKKKKKIKKKEKELKKQEGSIVKIKPVISENEGDINEGQQEDILSGPKPMKSTEEPRRAMVPMTKEEYEKQQSQVRRVFDPDTGRERLVKGDGEIVEEVVSYERHKEINKLSTLGDGAAFQKSLGFNRYTDNKIYRS